MIPVLWRLQTHLVGLILLWCLQTGCKQENPQRVISKPAADGLLAVIEANEKSVPSQGPSGHHGAVPSPESAQEVQVIFAKNGPGVAYSTTRNGKTYVVHNGKPGRPYAAIQDMVISPDGARVAYGALDDGKWVLVVDGVEGDRFDSLGPPAFSPDSMHVAYEAKKGEKWHIVVDGNMSSEAYSYFDIPKFSGDSKKILAIEVPSEPAPPTFVISDLKFKERTARIIPSLEYAVSEDQTRIAVVVENGKRIGVIEFSFDHPGNVTESRLYDAAGTLSYGKDNASLAYIAYANGKRYVVLNDKEEILPKGDLLCPPVIRPADKGVGILMVNSRKRCFLHEAFGRGERKNGGYDEARDLVYSPDGNTHAYAAREGNNWFIVVNGNKGPAYDRTITPMFSPDGRYLVYRARKDNARFAVVADPKGVVLKEYPHYDMVFDIGFSTDGKSIFYGVKDGTKLIWKTEKL